MAANFYFESLLTTALNGISSSGVISTMGHVSQGFIVATVLYQVYETFWRGGDYHELGTVLIKGMCMTTLLANYDAVFRLVVSGFSGIAHTLLTSSAGAGDLINQWLKDASKDWGATAGLSAVWDVVKGGGAAMLNLILIVPSYVILALAYILLSLGYLVVGIVLYGLGQLVLALYPSGALGSYTKSYLKNVAAWGMWPVIYALFSDLLVAINMNTVDAVKSANGFLGGLLGVGSMLLIALASLVLAIGVALIPILAHMIIQGDIGGAVGKVAGTAVSTGRNLLHRNPPPPPPGG
ncbi:MAG: hypothetical protein JO356_00855 [Acidobacteria bacterium]|nr:hypothetical protein [Acidobacteriota bacterium]